MQYKKFAARAMATVLAATLFLSACDAGDTTDDTTTAATTTTTTEAETDPVDEETDDTEDSAETDEPVDTEDTDEPSDTDEPADTGEPADSEEPTDTEEEIDESELLESPDTYEPAEPVTITYAGWENDLNFAIITDRFTQRHPNITVERFESNFVDEPELTRLAAAGELPHVISINNIGLSARNGWLLDLSERFYNDPIAEQVSYDNIIQSLKIMDRLYALPTTIFFGGLVVNLDLLEANNIPIPDYDWTVSEMTDIIRDATVRGESVGAMDLWFIYNWIPGSYEDDGVGRMFFNSETKRFELGRAWEDLVNLYKDLINSNVSVWEHADLIGLPWELDEGDPERAKQEDARAALQIDLYGSTDHGWDIGRSAMAPWESHGMGWLENIPVYTGFKYDYYPYPKADDNDSEGIRPGLVTDLAGISTSATDVDAAWEFLKYITFEGVGYLDRIDELYNYDRDAVIEKYDFSEEVIEGLPEDPALLYQTQGPHMNQIPPSNTKIVLDAYKEFHPIGSPDATPGFNYQLDYIENGYLDLHRNQPGFNDGFGYIHNNLWNEVVWGTMAPADIAQEVEDGANAILDEWMSAIEEAIALQEAN